MYETELWPFIEARWFGAKREKTLWVVVHDMEFPERMTAAEDIARDFARRPESNQASAHVCVDCDSVIQCVKDSYKAFAAHKTGNAYGVHIELAGFGSQTAKQWRDNYSNALLAIGADVAAQYCIKYGLPAFHLSDEQLRAMKPGIVGHDQISRVFKESDHTDPGPSFPWPRFMAYTLGSYNERRV